MTATVSAGPGSYLAVPELKMMNEHQVEAAVVTFADRAARVLYELTAPEIMTVISQAQVVAQVSRLRRCSKKAQFAAQRIYVVANRRWGELLKAEAEAIARTAKMSDAEVKSEMLTTAQRKQAERARLLANLDEERFNKALARSEQRQAGPTVGGTLAEARGSTTGVTEIRISMTPERLGKLDDYASSKGWTRSEVVGRLIDRLV
jgi:hypothetical protein